MLEISQMPPGPGMRVIGYRDGPRRGKHRGGVVNSRPEAAQFTTADGGRRAPPPAFYRVPIIPARLFFLTAYL